MPKKKAGKKAGKSNNANMASMRSVRRCFQMLEFFDSVREPVSATELANELDAPLSSTIDLLKCVCELGYVAYDSGTRTYHPTTRVGLLGDWLTINPLDQSNFSQVMENLLEETKETISLFWKNDIEMKCIHSLQGTHAISFRVDPGESVPLFGSAVGDALMSKWNDADIKKAYRRYKRKSSANDIAPLDEHMERIEKVRANGYATGYELVIPEVGAIAAAAMISNNRWVVFSIGGLSQRVKAQEANFTKLLVDSLS